MTDPNERLLRALIGGYNVVATHDDPALLYEYISNAIAYPELLAVVEVVRASHRPRSVGSDYCICGQFIDRCNSAKALAALAAKLEK